MAITIIKEGRQQDYKFKTTCTVCGCEFEYELCDLEKEYDYSMILTTSPCQYRYSRYVACPCCKTRIYHDSGTDFGDDGHHKPLNVIYTTGYVTNPLKKTFNCEECINRPDPDNPVVGDSPCTWCDKLQPKCE